VSAVIEYTNTHDCDFCAAELLMTLEGLKLEADETSSNDMVTFFLYLTAYDKGHGLG
jgi:hypothetical protein